LEVHISVLKKVNTSYPNITVRTMFFGKHISNLLRTYQTKKLQDNVYQRFLSLLDGCVYNE
jgi:hypothetical protein